GSSLARWCEALERQPTSRETRQRIGILAREVQRALDDPAVLEGPDAQVYGDLLSQRGPYWAQGPGDLPSEKRTTLAKLTAELDALKKIPLPPIPFVNGAQEGGCPLSPQAGLH